eukprot:scaffold4079_cov167-Amphora_coffeaeformis.AAC.10
MTIQARIQDPKFDEAVEDASEIIEAGASIEAMVKFSDRIIIAPFGQGRRQPGGSLPGRSGTLLFEFWRKHNSGRKDRNLFSEGSDVFIADGVGALQGLILGPITSIADGTAVSVAKNEGWILKKNTYSHDSTTRNKIHSRNSFLFLLNPTPWLQ